MKKKLSSKKDYIKLVRGILQGIVLLIITIVLIRTLFAFNAYTPNEDISGIKYDGKSGFITLSYFGVNRTGANRILSTERLEEHLKSLHNNGYVTITQQDIINYYTKGKKLPEKALFLIFEDGYRGTAIFAQKIMEEYNFKATMLTYPETFDNKDARFLTLEDLIDLEKSTFWELGTNGYRLEYINVFDKYDNYLGELTTLEFSEVVNELERNYNHYLMDYIRDENGIPKETYSEMKERITKDYEMLKEVYNKGIGYIPRLHVLMHSNTDGFGNNDRVSSVNEENIKELFPMNFNREGYSVNNLESNIYDLTRMQPQEYWYTNHLLMRIADDTKETVLFEKGDINKYEKWEAIKGATEFRGDTITLTSLPKDTGLIRLKESGNYKGIKISTKLTGNIIGSQGIYLRADENLENYIKVQILNNYLYLYQSLDGNEALIYEEQFKMESEDEESTIQINTPGYRVLNIELKNDTINVNIDGLNLINDHKVNIISGGNIYLESAWGEYGYSQRNLSDDVYDGVFEELYVTEIENDKIIYDNRYSGFEKVVVKIKELWHKTINWFIENL